MMARRSLGRIGFLTLLMLFVGTGKMQAQDQSQHRVRAGVTGPPVSTAPWTIETIDSTRYVRTGQHVSVAIDRNTGSPTISYHHATDGDLYLAARVGSAGNCGPRNDWSCFAIDVVDNVGQYSSLALEPRAEPSFYGWPKIAYYNATDQAFEYLAYEPPNMWRATRVYHEPLQDAGDYASLVLDSTGTPHIAFHAFDPRFGGNDILKYATYTGSGRDNCGGGNWQCDTISTGAEGGKHASLHVSSGDSPSIAYQDEYGDLVVATKGGYFANCGPGGDTWTCLTVDFWGDTGMYASMVRDGGGMLHVAYYDATEAVLKHAEFVGWDGNCGWSSDVNAYTWQCDEIDHMGTSLTHMGISLAVDDDDRTIIAYQQVSEVGPAVLRIARPAAALGLIHGNCGPGDLFQTWQCEVIDRGDSHTSVGDYVDIELDDDGLAIIAYYGYNDYYLFGSLKVAYQELVTVYLPVIAK